MTVNITAKQNINKNPALHILDINFLNKNVTPAKTKHFQPLISSIKVNSTNYEYLKK